MDKETILTRTNDELNELIALHFMGWAVHFSNTALYCKQEEQYTAMTRSPASVDMWKPALILDQAWFIVNKLQEMEYWLKITAGRNGKWEPSATVEVGKLPDTDGNISRSIAYVSGDSVPRMICQMAIVAIFDH